MSDVTPPPELADEEQESAEQEGGGGLLDRMRGTGVGVEDENIVGDVGPGDVAPGQDPDGGGSGVLPIEEGDDPGEV